MHAPRFFTVILFLLAALGSAHAQSPQLEVVGRLDLPYSSPEIAVWNNLAAITLYPIPGGKSEVRLVDVADLAQPRAVATLAGPQFVEYRDPRLLAVTTPTFTGDLLAVGRWNGGPRTGDGAAEFYDVRDATHPRLMGRVPTLYGVRSLDLVRREGRLLALLAVNGDEMWVVDATDLARPVLLSIWQPSGDITRNVRRGLSLTTLIERVRAGSDGLRAYATCGDAGTFVVDLADLSQPKTLARSAYTMDDEGNAFDAAEAAGGRLLVTTDWDLTPAPAGVSLRILNPPTLRSVQPFHAVEPDFTRQLAAAGPIRSEVVPIGQALTGQPLLTDPRGKIALVTEAPAPNDNERTVRTRQAQQAQRALDAGAVAVLFSGLIQRWPETAEKAAIPAVSIETWLGDAMRAEMAKNRKVEVEFAAGPATFGFVRLWDLTSPRRQTLTQLGAFTGPAARSSTSHLFLAGDRLYVAWGTEGIRVIDLRDPVQPREIGHFALPDNPNFGVAGVVAQNGLIYATAQTETKGLLILRDVAN